MTTDDQIRDAINAQHDRIESALSAALGDPDLGAYPGDPDGAPDLESLIAMVAGLRRQRDEARRERDEMAADLQSASERIDIDQEVMTRLEGERDAARATLPVEVLALARFYTTGADQEFWRCLACGGEWPCDIVTACATCHGPKDTP